MADSLFLGLVILACIFGLPLLYKLWVLPLEAIAILVIASLGIGHALGRLDRDTRSTLAIFCVARNFGLALFIAILNHVEQQMIPTLVAHLILGTCMGATRFCEMAELGEAGEEKSIFYYFILQ